MTDHMTDEQIEAEIERLNENMSPLLKGFFLGSALFFAYAAVALIGFVPGFPGLIVVMLVLMVIQVAVQYLHPDMKRKRELAKKLNS